LKKLFSGMLLALSLALVLSVPAFAATTGKTTDDGTLGSTTMNAGRAGVTTNARDGFYGTTGTYNPYGTGAYGPNGTFGTYSRDGAFGTNGYYGNYDGTRMNAYRPYATNLTNRANNTVRRMETTTTRRGFDWGWLGLLGLFGLAGMRSRNRDEAR